MNTTEALVNGLSVYTKRIIGTAQRYSRESDQCQSTYGLCNTSRSILPNYSVYKY